ncbi:MAG TPA: hypothetical protein VGR09_03695, partial [Gemmatimonadales bacterium]|nr:hypothetical protein [Gemmatimonadales bacterium]
MTWTRAVAVGLLCTACAIQGALGQDGSRRKLTLDDLYRFRDVDGPQVSPEGGWVAYSVSAPDVAK